MSRLDRGHASSASLPQRQELCPSSWSVTLELLGDTSDTVPFPHTLQPPLLQQLLSCLHCAHVC